MPQSRYSDRLLVRSARVSDKGGRSIELYDRLEALREIDRILGMITKKVEAAEGRTLKICMRTWGDDNTFV